MAMPPRVFISITELAARWMTDPQTILQWAAADHFKILTSLPRAKSGETMIAGLVQIDVQDVLYAPPEHARAFRVKRHPARDDAEWLPITEPANGIRVETCTLAVPLQEALGFEDEHQLLPQKRTMPSRPKYDWDEMWQHICLRIYREGLPESQNALVQEVQEFFARRDETGEAPDSRTIRRRLTPLWRELRGQE